MDANLVHQIESILWNVVNDIKTNSTPTIKITRPSKKYLPFSNLVSCTDRTTDICMDKTRSIRSFTMHLRILEIAHGLLLANKTCTMRDVYYQDVQLFKSQGTVNAVLCNIATSLRVPRDSLRIVTACRGLLYGDVQVALENDQILSAGELAGSVVVPNVASIKHISSSARFVLVVEKEAVFAKIMADYNLIASAVGPFILITGKGYPCMGTRRFLNFLTRRTSIQHYLALVDYDPYGLEICYHYRVGTRILPMEQDQLRVDGMVLFGITHQDLDR